MRQRAISLGFGRDARCRSRHFPLVADYSPIATAGGAANLRTNPPPRLSSSAIAPQLVVGQFARRATPQR